MKRRRWIQLASSTLPLGGIQLTHAKEGTGNWDDESICEYCHLLITWLQENFASRAKQLESHNGEPFELNYDYLGPTTDKKLLRIREKFEEENLSRRATEDHVVKCLTELEAVRKSLSEAEAQAEKTWKPDSDSIVVKDGKIYDTSISAGRLTVILDKSRSMTPYLDKLRDEIARDFSEAYFVEVDGCHLDRSDNVPWFYSAPASGVNPFSANRHIPKVPTWEDSPYSTFIGWTRAAPSAIEAMVDLMHADAIYWFCDFDDGDDDSIIRLVARKLLEKKVKLYAHTLDKRPPSLISLLAERSGGQVIRKRI